MKHWDEVNINTSSQTKSFIQHQKPEPVKLPSGVPTSASGTPSNSGLNPALTIERFVVGESNRTAYQAAMDTINHSGEAESPVIIYGGVGLGKTHLLHAIGNQFREKHLDKTVFCVSSERFIHEWIQSIAHPQKYSALQRQYHNIELLLIDDLQFLTQEKRIQEEFVDLLNHLTRQNRRLVCTCDRLPNFLESYLATTNSPNSSPMVQIHPPEFDLRVSILKQKLQERNWGPVPVKVVRYIAKHLTQHIRELEGCLNRLMAEARLGSDLNLEVASRVIQGGQPDFIPPSNLSLEMIQDAVARYFHITLSDLCSRKRGKRYALPRQIAMYLARQLTTLSLRQIGQGFGYSHHTTVVHSLQRVESLLQEDLVLSQSIAALQAELTHTVPY